MYDRFYKELDKAIAEVGSLRKLSKQINFSATYISMVQRKEEKPSDAFLAVFGFVKICRVKKGKKWIIKNFCKEKNIAQ